MILDDLRIIKETLDSFDAGVAHPQQYGNAIAALRRVKRVIATKRYADTSRDGAYFFLMKPRSK